MTLILRMKGKINNVNAPKLVLHDPIEDRVGSLFLWDAALSPISSTAKFTELPNLLSEYGDNSNNLFEIMTYGATLPDNNYIRTELTNKGGIHFIVSQSAVTDKTVTDGFYLQPEAELAQKLLDRILTNSANLFVSIWTNHTRKVDRNDGLGGIMFWLANNTTNQVFAMNQAQAKPTGTLGTLKYSESKLNLNSKSAEIVNKPNNYQFVIDKYVGTAPNISQRLRIGSGILQPYSGGIVTNQAINATPSYIVYRVYIEDLNLSGRTFEEVKAIDDAEHAKAFANGGRFYDDTWSDPVTSLP